MDELEYSASNQVGYGAKAIRRQSTPEQLRAKKQHLEQELQRVNDAIDFLTKNPEFEKGLQLISMAL